MMNKKEIRNAFIKEARNLHIKTRQLLSTSQHIDVDSLNNITIILVAIYELLDEFGGVDSISSKKSVDAFNILNDLIDCYLHRSQLHLRAKNYELSLNDSNKGIDLILRVSKIFKKKSCFEATWKKLWLLKAKVFEECHNYPLEQKCILMSISWPRTTVPEKNSDIYTLLQNNYQKLMTPSSNEVNVHDSFHTFCHWKLLYLDGKLPPKFNASSVLYDDFIYIFGGAMYKSNRLIPTNSVWRINTQTFECEKFDVNESYIPSPRSKHTAVLHNSMMYILGGEEVDPRDESGLFLQLNLETKVWSKIKCKNTIPRLYGHSACTYNDKMYVFGGEIFEDYWGIVHYSNSLFEYCFTRNVWREVKTNGTHKPSPRAHHACWIIDDVMYIFGGIYKSEFRSKNVEYREDLFSINLSNMTWVRLPLVGNYPIGRSEMGIATMNGKAYIFGGTSKLTCYWPELNSIQNTAFFNDLYEYNPSTNRFKSVIGKGALPSFRASPYMIQKDEVIWCIGGHYGIDHYSGFNDAYSFKLTDNVMPNYSQPDSWKLSISNLRTEPFEGKESTVVKRCLKCNKTEAEIGYSLFKCESCGAPYCSKQCQLSDWPSHQSLCYVD